MVLSRLEAEEYECKLGQIDMASPSDLLPALRAAYRRGAVVGLDTEYSEDGRLACWSIAIPEPTVTYMGVEVAVPYVLLPDAVPALARWLASDAPKVAHAGNGDAHRLRQAGAIVANLHCTLTLSRLVQAHLPKHDLKGLVTAEFGYTPPGKFGALFRGRDVHAMTAARDPVWLHYAALDAKYVAEEYQVLIKRADKELVNPYVGCGV